MGGRQADPKSRSPDVEHDGGSMETQLYLVRMWKRKSGDGELTLRGKLQSTVSGASCYFNGLSSLPLALEKMMEQEAGSPVPGTTAVTEDGPDS
jgi:hypothetical protein